jgi:hypothetical protein
MNFDYTAEKLKQIKNTTREGFLVWLDKSIETLKRPPPVTISYYAPSAEIRSDHSVTQITDEDIKSLTWPMSNAFFEKAKNSIEIPVAVSSLGEAPSSQAPPLNSDSSAVAAPEANKAEANEEATSNTPATATTHAPAPAATHAPAPATETATKTPAEASSGVAVDLSKLK